MQKESAGTPLSVEVAHRSAASLEENDASKNPGMHSTLFLSFLSRFSGPPAAAAACRQTYPHPAKSHSVSRSAAFKSSKVLWASGGSQAWRWSATG